MRNTPLHALAVAISAAITMAHAEQDVRLDSLVVSASGFEQKITDAPASKPSPAISG